MVGLSQSIELQVFSKTPLLITESSGDFAVLAEALTQEIKPRSVLERFYVDDIAALVWEIRRLRRCKNVIINIAFKDALSEIVYRLAGEPELETPKREWVDNVCRDWFSKPEARKEVLELLDEFRLDESAIEAEAIQSRFSELEMFDKMLTLQESRLDKALRSIADYRASFAKQVREVSNRVIEGDPVVQLENRSTKKSA
jgi:hypothetical protein